MVTEEAPVVFIVDDDASVRRSIQDLLSSVVLRSEAFATPLQALSLNLLPRFPRVALPEGQECVSRRRKVCHEDYVRSARAQRWIKRRAHTT
jgi:hypothetical protein